MRHVVLCLIQTWPIYFLHSYNLVQLFDSTQVFESAVNLNLSTHADPENDSMIVTRFYSHKDLKFAPTMFMRVHWANTPYEEC